MVSTSIIDRCTVSSGVRGDKSSGCGGYEQTHYRAATLSFICDVILSTHGLFVLLFLEKTTFKPYFTK